MSNQIEKIAAPTQINYCNENHIRHLKTNMTMSLLSNDGQQLNCPTMSIASLLKLGKSIHWNVKKEKPNKYTRVKNSKTNCSHQKKKSLRNVNVNFSSDNKQLVLTISS